jgi:nucleotide-binding universal stress UspA family protein
METARCTTQIKLKSILLATDLSEASMHATRYAISLAARYGGKLYAAHVISLDALVLAHPEALDRILKEANDYAECALGELLATARRQALPCEALVGVGDITNVLRGFVEKYEADLVVVGTSGRAGLGKVFLGSVAEEIIRDTPCPVLTVGARAADMTASDILNVLRAIDFSQESLHASEYAFFLAQKYNAHLALLHVVGGLMDEPPSHSVQLLSQALRELISLQPQLSYEPEIVVAGGPVADRILEFATERSAHLIVMGVRGVGAFASQASRFGSIAHEVISRSSCPVLTTSAGKGSPVNDFGTDR